MLKGKKILITSGPTRMPLDAVRYISNFSTGTFGTLLAKEALRRRAQVTFVYGKGSQTPNKHRRLKLISVETNPEVAAVLQKELKRVSYDVVCHAMAVLDYQADSTRKQKTKTNKGEWVLRLVPTPKIILSLKKWDPRIFLVGFKLEVGISQKELLRRARDLARRAKADLVLANQLQAGEDERHEGILIDRVGNVLARVKGKKNLAKLILQSVGKQL